MKEIADMIHQVKVEKNGNIEYWYDEDDNTFLGQGATVEEIITHIKVRFPTHIFLVEERGGVSPQTNWKLIPHEEFKNIQLTSKDL